MLGMIPSLTITLFLGIGSILAGNAKELPNQKLPLRTDGCYWNETDVTSNFITRFSISENDGWKDQEYSTLNTIFSISYLWQPLITVVSSVVFGLLFSVIINQYRKSPPVKSRYLSPYIVTMWVKILGKEKLEQWIEFEDENTDMNENDLKKNESIGMGTIPRATLSVCKSNYYFHAKIKRLMYISYVCWNVSDQTRR